MNNAAAPGGLARGRLSEIRDEDVLLDLDTKVMGYLRCARAVAPYMQRQGWGRIVNVGGLSARRAEGNLSAGVRNSALSNLTKYLAEELGGDGVCVNLVHPGTTRTERSGPMYAEQAQREGVSVEPKSRVASPPATPPAASWTPRSWPGWWHSWPRPAASPSAARPSQPAAEPAPTSITDTNPSFPPHTRHSGESRNPEHQEQQR